MKAFTLLLFLLLLFQTANLQAQTPTNPVLARQLDSILVLDQGLRLGLDSMNEKYAWDSPQMQEYWQRILLQDSLNQLFVFRILDTQGWPTIRQIGKQGSTALFMVVQHAPIDKQEHYFPMLQRAAKAGNLRLDELAMLEDRIEMQNGRLQIYGSQLTQDNKTKELVVWPLKNPESVDARRKSVGLSTMQENLSSWNLKWDVKAYKKQLPELMRILEVTP